MVGLYGRVTTRQHDSNFYIHEGFGDFYVLLGDSRGLYKTSTTKKDKLVDVNAKKKQEPNDYEKAMDEYATVSFEVNELAYSYSTPTSN
jgi:hypothetical protein